MNIGVIGLGKLGMCLAGVLAQKHEVYGVDVVEMIPKENEDKDLQQMNLERLIISTDFSMLKDCEVVFNVVPTPSMPDGSFSNKYIYSSIEKSWKHLNCDLYVVTSTVMPGTCNALAKYLPCGDICYNPEFIRLGHVVSDMYKPDFILIGEENKKAGDLLENVYKDIVNAPIKRMGLKSAELAKMALNSYITMKISFANSVNEIANKIGADGETILDAIGEDRRIGTEYFKPGGAYGGPCFPRDNRAFSHVAGDIPNYASLTDKINIHQSKQTGFHNKSKRYSTL